jgi:hypothetical protein
MLFKSSSKSDDANVAVLEPLIDTAVAAAKPVPNKAKGKKKEEDLDYEWEFDTPFGKLEFELEPRKTHEEKERKRQAKAEADAARKAAKKTAKLAKLAAKEAEKRGIDGPVVIVKRSNLVPALVIFTIIAVGVGVAIWLFARPDEIEDEIPAELRKDGAYAAAEPEPSGPMGRLKHAIRAGRKASREAQDEQQRRFEEMTKQG